MLPFTSHWLDTEENESQGHGRATRWKDSGSLSHFTEKRQPAVFALRC